MKAVTLSLCIMLVFAQCARASETAAYSYDAQGRLVEVNHTGSGDNANLKTAYQYDLAGNRVVYTVTGSKNRGQQVVVVPLNGFTVIPINP